MRSRDCFFKKNNTMYIVPKLFQNAVCVPQRIKIYAMEEFWHWDSCTICFGRRDHLTFIMTSCLFHKIDSSGGFFLKSFTIGLCVCNMRQVQPETFPKNSNFSSWDFLILLMVFELLPKTCNFTICSIFSNSGHVCWCTASPDTILKLDTLVMIQTKFGFHWSSTFRGEDFWKSLRRQ